MKHLFTTLTLLLLFVGTSFAQTAQDAQDAEEEVNIPTGGLNAIRFGEWGAKEWSDNDYYRHLRRCLNDYAADKVEPIWKELWKELNPYKKIITSPYFIFWAEPFDYGGMQLYITFLADTSLTFFVWIYSYVEDDYSISRYEVRAIDIAEDFPVTYTPDEIKRIIDESNGKFKLW